MPPSAMARSVASDHVARRLVTGPPMLAQQEQQLARPRKLRRVAEPAAPLIEGGGKLVHGGVEHAGRRDRAVPGMAPKRSQALDDGGGGLEDLRPRSSRQTRAISSRTRRSRAFPTATSAESRCRRRTAPAWA